MELPDNMHFVCRVCRKPVHDVKYYADPQFWEVSMKQIFCSVSLTMMKKFKSVNNIKTKSIKELNSVVGQNKARIIYNYFNS